MSKLSVKPLWQKEQTFLFLLLSSSESPVVLWLECMSGLYVVKIMGLTHVRDSMGTVSHGCDKMISYLH